MLLILLGLIGLTIASDVAVQAGKTLAKQLGVSHLVIGLTLTSIGTSLPEIATNVAAGWSSRHGLDASGIAVGNVIGSNLSQITLLLGIAGFIATLTIPTHSLRRDGTTLLVSVLAMWGCAWNGVVSQVEGALLVGAYVIYLVGVVVDERRRATPAPDDEQQGAQIAMEVVKGLVGLGVVWFCADLVVDEGVVLARSMGVSDAIIGLFVGFGTGLPELTVAIRAIRAEAGALSLGNLLGSNISDPLLSFGLGALVHEVTVSPTMLRFDFPYWLVATLVALLLLHNHKNLNRKESSVLLLLFGLFLYLRLVLL